ncbi:MAG: DNA mismatch repair protein MutS [Halobacteriales archaeon]
MAATGAPEELAAVRDDLTPMMAQYFEVCSRYEDSLVLFHVGDFYKTFCEAAETVARLCELTLVEREDSTGSYPMAGIPIENAESYIERLLDAGYRVAVAEQVEDPEAVSGVAERRVTRVVTPGTLTEAELLAGDDHTFVAAAAQEGERYGLALLDVSTGDFYATGGGRRAIRDEAGRFSPAEAIVGPGIEDPGELFDASCTVSGYEARAFEAERARERVGAYFGSPEGTLASPAEVRACGALLAYAEYTRGGGDRLGYLNHLTRYDPREYMLLDPAAIESLELFERRSVHGDGPALIDVLDRTESALGGRALRDWLRRPLVDPERIEARLDAVEELTGALRTRERVAERLREVYDIERLISRVSRGRADARDLRSLAATLEVVPEIEAALADADAPKLRELREDLDPVEEIRELIGRAIDPDPPTELTEGGIIREGYDDDLDALRETEREGKDWIADLEERERERTGIDSLEVGHNAVHGYYIEVTDANLDRVPGDYVRRQTLKNAERFYTPELKEREDEILRAEQRADEREYERFLEVRERVAGATERVQALADRLAELDALIALADVAAERDYAKPEIAEEGIAIRGGRHPVVERTQEEFVPNDARLDREDRIAVLTGPNMSGKSTYMRQVALIVLLAQVGSFVPAEAAEVRIVDRIFTRVGASDDIAGGQSTFMVEMTELADILRAATEDSLVLLDEVGRGTSTADGLAIAQAVTEHLHDEARSRTLFATHHHDLTAVAGDLPGAFNLHFDADRSAEGIAFHHNVARGASASSYGVDVAELAGVPDPVVERARSLVDAEGGAAGTEEREAGSGNADGRPRERDPLRERLETVDPARTTPLEALELLAELAEEV